MKTLFKNANILDVEKGLVYKSDLLVVDKYIAKIDKHIDEAVDEKINASKLLLMPTFKNGHTHSPMTFLRGLIDNVSLEDWLFKHIIPRENLLDEDDVYKFSKVALLEYIRNGIGYVNDMYIFPEGFIRATKELNYPCSISMGTDQKVYRDCLKDPNHFIELNKSHERVNFIFNAHSVYTISEKDLLDLSSIANKLHSPVFLHLSETMTEVNNCINAHGLTPVGYANALGLFNYGGGGYHLVHPTDDDFSIIKTKNIKVISNPGSNLKLSSGIAPLRQYKKLGIEVGLGTDGPAPNNALSMFYEMRLAFNLENLSSSSLEGLTPIDVLKMATINVAHIFNLKKCDSLKEGNYADLIAIKLDSPDLFPNSKIISHLVNAANENDIYLTMINGLIYYCNGKFASFIDTKKIYKDANKSLKCIEKKIKKLKL